MLGSASLAFAACKGRLPSPSSPLAAPAAPPDETYVSEVVGFGPLEPDPDRVFDLPSGFSYRIVSRAGDRMSDGLVVPGKPDGMGCFDLGGGRIALVRNHELGSGDQARGSGAAALPRSRFYDGRDGKPCPGGTTTLILDAPTGTVESQHLSLAGTLVNCAGGTTPWGSWLSCEETVETGELAHGWVFEVPAAAKAPVEPLPLKAMGRFLHEAAAVDPRTGIVYLTEDRPDSLFYRFLPLVPGRLSSGGRLQALALDGIADARNWDEQTLAEGSWHNARWIGLDQVESPDDDLRLRGHAAGAARFARGEGIHCGVGELYFTCTSGGAARHGQIMRYVPSRYEGHPRERDEPARLQLFAESSSAKLFDYVDNVTVSPASHLILCEDRAVSNPINHLKGATPYGRIYTIGRNVHCQGGELAGVCFSPDGATLFLNLYRPGLTLAVTGPWASFDGTRLAV